jgi:hypothetical protein
VGRMARRQDGRAAGWKGCSCEAGEHVGAVMAMTWVGRWWLKGGASSCRIGRRHHRAVSNQIGRPKTIPWPGQASLLLWLCATLLCLAIELVGGRCRL